jgi:hypothetical protein
VLVELGTASSEAAPRAKVTAAFDGHDEVLKLGFPNGVHPEASEAQKSSVFPEASTALLQIRMIERVVIG